jgi:hypothetical protein
MELRKMKKEKTKSDLLLDEMNERIIDLTKELIDGDMSLESTLKSVERDTLMGISKQITCPSRLDAEAETWENILVSLQKDLKERGFLFIELEIEKAKKRISVYNKIKNAILEM